MISLFRITLVTSCWLSRAGKRVRVWASSYKVTHLYSAHSALNPWSSRGVRGNSKHPPDLYICMCVNMYTGFAPSNHTFVIANPIVCLFYRSILLVCLFIGHFHNQIAKNNNCDKFFVKKMKKFLVIKCITLP